MVSLRIIAQIVMLGSMGAWLSCRNGVDVDEIRSNVQRHRAQWDDTGLTTYRFDFLRRCLCRGIQPVTIEVDHGVIVAVTNRDTGAQLPGDEFADYVTVEDLFDTIQDAIDQDPYSIEASFDPLLGYPTRIVIDPQRFVANDEITMTSAALEST
jgi:Family of unknown function (DUF6174)